MLSPVLMFLTLLLIGLGLSSLTQLIYKKFTDQEALKKIEKKTKELQDKIKNTGPDKQQGYQSEMLKLTSKRMKLTIKPMLISSVMFFAVFPVLKRFYKGFILLKFPFTLPFIHNDIGWLLSYIIFTMIGSMIFKKVLRNQ